MVSYPFRQFYSILLVLFVYIAMANPAAVAKSLRLVRPVQAAISGATGAGRENEWLDGLMDVVPESTLDSLVAHRGWHDKTDDLSR